MRCSGSQKDLKTRPRWEVDLVLTCPRTTSYSAACKYGVEHVDVIATCVHQRPEVIFSTDHVMVWFEGICPWGGGVSSN